MKKKPAPYIIIFTLFICILSLQGGTRWYKIYFTKNTVKNSENPRNALIDLINKSRHSINAAFYDISDIKIANALIKAHQKGIRIKLVTETDNFNRKAVTRLINNGISVRGDNSRGLMHHKFAVFDKKILWTGSYNISVNGYKNNNNNAMCFHLRDLCRIYLKEFNEMYTHNVYQNQKEKGPFTNFKSYSVTTPDKTKIHVYFSPEDSIEDIILKRIEKSRKSITFMAYSFTSNKIGEAIIRKHKEGIKVTGIFERRGTYQKHSEYLKMRLEGLKVYKDKNRYSMHHKVIIIDEKIVIAGSYNFSSNANRHNDENILIITNTAIAQKYTAEFNRLKPVK